MSLDEKAILDEMESKLHLIWQQKRLDTFASWPFGEEAPCSASKLAEAGFFFTSKPDAVQCFYCDKSLDGWEESDDPWSEHVSHSPNCDFAKLQQSEDALTFEQFSNLHKQFIAKQAEAFMQKVQSTSNKMFTTRLAKYKRSLATIKMK